MAEEQQVSEQQKTKKRKNWSAEVKKIGDQIIGLTLMQAQELGDYLKEEYGIEPAGGGVVAVAGLAEGGGQAEAPEEKTSFNVVLKEIGDKKLQVVKEVRALTTLGLKEAKAIVDNAPKTVKEGVSKEEAEEAKAKLEAAGATIELT